MPLKRSPSLGRRCLRGGCNSSESLSAALSSPRCHADFLLELPCAFRSPESQGVLGDSPGVSFWSAS